MVKINYPTLILLLLCGFLTLSGCQTSPRNFKNNVINRNYILNFGSYSSHASLEIIAHEVKEGTRKSKYPENLIDDATRATSAAHIYAYVFSTPDNYALFLKHDGSFMFQTNVTNQSVASDQNTTTFQKASSAVNVDTYQLKIDDNVYGYYPCELLTQSKQSFSKLCRTQPTSIYTVKFSAKHKLELLDIWLPFHDQRLTIEPN